MYDTQQEAQQKLSTCIVGFDGKPFYIVEAGTNPEGLCLYGSLCTTGEVSSTEYYLINDPRWEFKNLGGKLGYTDFEGIDGYKASVYARRVPVRAAQRTQGLAAGNVKISRLPACQAMGTSSQGVTWGRLNRQKGFFDTWDGKFLDIRSIRTQMKKSTVMGRALGRCLAIQRSPLDLFYLMYKGEPVGHSEDLELFKVPKQFRYLDELFIEDHNLKIQ